MDRKRARHVLGVAPDASLDEIRAAFRRLVRSHHPDVVGGRGTERTTELIAAYRSLQGEPDVHPVTAPPPGQPAPPTSGRDHAAHAVYAAHADGDSVWVRLPTSMLWPHLLEVAHGLGEVAYVDASVGLLETVVTFIDYPVCSVVLNLQGRANGMTEANVSVESLTGDQPPPTSGVAHLIATSLATHLAEPH